MRAVDAAAVRAAPQRLGVLVTQGEALISNISGGFRRLQENVEEYPGYENAEEGVFLVHRRAMGSWVLAPGLLPDAGVLLEFPSDAPSPLALWVLKKVEGGWFDQLDARGRVISANMPTSTFYHVFCGLVEYLDFQNRQAGA